MSKNHARTLKLIAAATALWSGPAACRGAEEPLAAVGAPLAPTFSHVWGPEQMLLLGAVVAIFLLVACVSRRLARHSLDEVGAELARCRRREQELRESEAWHRALFTSSRDAVMLLDERGFFDCNDATLDVFGCASRDEFIACHPSELSPPTQPDGRDSREAADEKIQRALEEGTCHFQWRHRRVDGSPFMADVLLSRVAQNDRRALLALVRDISEQTRAEEALREASRSAMEANEAKTAFLANVSHELRTPLHGILSFASFGMRRTELLGEQELHEYFDLIRQSGQTLLELVDDLLDLSKLETGQADLCLGRVDMNTIILQIMDECRSLAADHRITIRLADADVAMPLECDESRMAQVIRNLLGNAIKYSHEGDTIQVAVVPATQGLTVSVTDHGVGIPEDELDRVFDKFYRSSRTRLGPGGTGLGLTLCREIVEAHGGRIWAENRPGGGTTIVFEVPLSPRGRVEPAAGRPACPASLDTADAPPAPASLAGQP